MNFKDRGSDMWRVWPTLMRRALPIFGAEEPQATIPARRSNVPASVRMDPDKPRPWRYVRWQKANEKQNLMPKPKVSRPKGNYVYKVLPGEDLGDISSKHETFTEVVMEANKILNPANVATGQLLWIPRTHHIQKGNTLWSLSRKFKVSISTIQTANGIENPDLIFAGDILVIPNEQK
ncbi:uncharacterized protein LOC112347910 [Selaginella moellendorffii]|uniref:uncharacterized protein LOC112346623 n=1 Tax=Selaginella moellendorffii TaxID=88036 RepID=UPI000D1C8232|nr:uncharacterized protein LOC112346623 [Selaginella moellendorffii]XP_024535367.1 uncharacterized protein LOC112347910 [Selaginella moellendorffii]|eukprot:XP_024531792.1 uncharacterized protein LOC112346623 [Selaginella moellendorffii]